jgi:hypothetical protein
LQRGAVRHCEVGERSLKLRVMLDVEELEQQPGQARRAADLAAQIPYRRPARSKLLPPGAGPTAASIPLRSRGPPRAMGSRRIGPGPRLRCEACPERPAERGSRHGLRNRPGGRAHPPT